MIGKRYQLCGGEEALCVLIGRFQVEIGSRYFNVFYLIENDRAVQVVQFNEITAALDDCDEVNDATCCET